MSVIFQPAVRKAVKVVVTVAGKSGSGKSLSALLLARGLVGPEGKIGVVDTENERAMIYADDPVVGGFLCAPMYPPFSPDAYIAAIDAAEAAGIDVLVIDTASHEWSGLGGCIEWAAKLDPNGSKGPTAWIKPKAAHKRFVNRLLQAQCHVICCLRADHKLVAYKDDRGKQQFAESDDLVPEQEKRFVYEATLSAVLDERTHAARFVKLPKPLLGHLAHGQLIGVETGAAIRAWVHGGVAVDKEFERQIAVCRDVASFGRARLEQHWRGLSAEWRQRLKPHMPAFGAIADAADAQEVPAELEPGQPGEELPL
jgi:energy-coupling factor transporter ATP-binding protein EcfA2